jgi:hypothetical protein
MGFKVHIVKEGSIYLVKDGEMYIDETGSRVANRLKAKEYFSEKEAVDKGFEIRDGR